jgi:hypothetical protein
MGLAVRGRAIRVLCYGRSRHWPRSVYAALHAERRKWEEINEIVQCNEDDASQGSDGR